MNESTNSFTQVFERLKTYITLQAEIILLTAGEKAAIFLAKLISNSVLVFFGILIFIFASFAAAFALSSWFNSYGLGFLTVALFYLLVVIIFIMLRRKYVEKPLIDKFISLFFSNNSGAKKDE